MATIPAGVTHEELLRIAAALSQSFGTDTFSEEDLPWTSPLNIPEYKEFQDDNWKLIRLDTRLIRGYYTGICVRTTPNYILIDRRTGETWMSLTPMELESQAPMAHFARGHTVIAGLGMGMNLFNILANPTVDKVTVLEHDPDVIKLFWKITNAEEWPGSHKMRIIETDAFTWEPDGTGIDFLASDVHLSLGDSGLREDTQLLCKRLQPASMAVWGIELDFITWCAERGESTNTITDSLWAHYGYMLGAPLFTFDGVARYADAVAHNTYRT